MDMGWITEFDRDFNVPREILDLVASGTLDDHSWRNDVCPSFGKEVAQDRFVRMFVERPDPDEREVPGSKRFLISIDEPDGSVTEVLETDDLGSALAALKKEIGVVPAEKPRGLLEEIYDLYHKGKSPEDKARLEKLVQQYGRRPGFMASTKSRMTKAWLDRNCRFGSGGRNRTR